MRRGVAVKIHGIARREHHAAHIAAVHRHLPDEARGELLMEPHAAQAHTKHWAPDDVVMVASYLDIALAGDRNVVYVEHGAGQAYRGAVGEASRYYHGGEHPDNVAGYIGPRQEVIDAWGRPGWAAGAPICDPYELYGEERVAAITFHWNGAAPSMVGVPEAGTAWEHYVDCLEAIVRTLRDEGWEVLGHHHPKFIHPVNRWHRLGVRIADADEVRRRASLLIADNTSLMYEMLYTGRSVIALNAPWYRRDVEHGLRFWEWAPKVQANDADELIDIIREHDRIQDRTSDLCDWSITQHVYGSPFSDGHDGRRAATWLSMFASGLQ